MMQLAERAKVPFWPATSVFDIPYTVLEWQRIAAEAEAEAEHQIAIRKPRPHAVA